MRELSGFGWDADRGMVTTSDQVWDDYLAVSQIIHIYCYPSDSMSQAHPKCEYYQSHLFPFYDIINEMYASNTATGTNVVSTEATEAHEAPTVMSFRVSVTCLWLIFAIRLCNHLHPPLLHPPLPHSLGLQWLHLVYGMPWPSSWTIHLSTLGSESVPLAVHYCHISPAQLIASQTLCQRPATSWA